MVLLLAKCVKTFLVAVNPDAAKLDDMILVLLQPEMNGLLHSSSF